MRTERLIAYIDGYNLYYGIRSKGWKWAYWMNPQAFVQGMLKPHQQLVETKYFTAIVTRPEGPHHRQALFLEALRTVPNLYLHFGHFLSNPVTCLNCGHTYETHHEKMTDVNIAVELLTDAFQDRLDAALLISADSDLAGAVKKVRDLPGKRVIAAFPPGRHSNTLKQVCDGYVYIGRNVLAKSLFPEEIVKSDGFRLRRPHEWR